ncbi:MAG: response regulator, partial [Pseudomonadota bacterium]
ADLVLMDLHMPKLSGLEAAQQIRATNNGGRPMTIIAFTAMGRERDRMGSLAACMDGFLQKPVSVDEIYRLLRDHLVEPASG